MSSRVSFKTKSTGYISTVKSNDYTDKTNKYISLIEPPVVPEILKMISLTK